MVSPLNKIKRTLHYHYYRFKNGWHFPSNMVHSSGARMAKGTHEPEVTRTVTHILDEGSVFLDVGANVGYYPRLASKIVTESGLIYAFEADYDNFHALCKNTAPLDNVTPLNFAVSDKQDFSEVFCSSHSSCHSMRKTADYLNGKKVNVPAITLDLFWKHYLDKEMVDLVKIDVEGAEILVLEGMKQMLEQEKVKTLIIECCPHILSDLEESPEDIMDFLAPWFSISVIEKEFRKFQENRYIQDKEEFNNIIRHLRRPDGTAHMNLVCRKKSIEQPF